MLPILKAPCEPNSLHIGYKVTWLKPQQLFKTNHECFPKSSHYSSRMGRLMAYHGVLILDNHQTAQSDIPQALVSRGLMTNMLRDNKCCTETVTCVQWTEITYCRHMERMCGVLTHLSAVDLAQSLGCRIIAVFSFTTGRITNLTWFTVTLLPYVFKYVKKA